MKNGNQSLFQTLHLLMLTPGMLTLYVSYDINSLCLRQFYLKYYIFRFYKHLLSTSMFSNKDIRKMLSEILKISIKFWPLLFSWNYKCETSTIRVAKCLHVSISFHHNYIPFNEFIYFLHKKVSNFFHNLYDCPHYLPH